MLLDANILLYAVDEESPFHEAARPWLEGTLNGDRRVGIPWQSLVAYVRIVTHPRALRQPLSPTVAWSTVEAWLDAPVTWVPAPGRRHSEILGRLIREHDLRANLIPDAVLAALCIEYGMQMVSADTDFARFREISWYNPVAR
ncbi:MAG TPA: type II toxin-antitoxin system VapC family toxin [Acidimicrobiales bacterium]|nr:type II toxin-antitoxin system VapC family toxin [Acidimicrobiales bacterium]